MIKTITLYPSTQNFQRSNDRVVPLSWALSYLKNLYEQIPANERESAEISWAPKITYEHQLSELEVMQERQQRVREWLAGLPRDGADEDAIKRLRTILGL